MILAPKQVIQNVLLYFKIFFWSFYGLYSQESSSTNLVDVAIGKKQSNMFPTPLLSMKTIWIEGSEA